MASERYGIARPVACWPSPFFMASAVEWISKVNAAVLSRIRVSLLNASECLGSAIVSKDVADTTDLTEVDATGLLVTAGKLLLPTLERAAS
jgi:hypothetical protein